MFVQNILLILLSISLIFFQSKYFLLIDSPQEQKHKLNYNKNIPLSGGIYFFLAITANILLSNYNVQNLMIIMFLFMFLILGTYSDLKRNFSPKIRLLYQAILVVLMIISIDLGINKTNIFFLDNFISNNFFNLLFTFSCILVLLNGSNFCDGINCNIVGYYLIVILAIFFSGLSVPNTFFEIENIIIIFAIFYIFNFFGKYFLGDNGVYIISIFVSIYVIEFINFNNNVSSLLALNLLWYPAFENLFTIIRRIFSKTKIQIADRSHLHIFIFEKISKKISIKISNTLAGVILNIYMFIGIFISIKYYTQSKILILIFVINIIIYVISYFLLKSSNFDLDKKTTNMTDNKIDIINK